MAEQQSEQREQTTDATVDQQSEQQQQQTTPDPILSLGSGGVSIMGRITSLHPQSDGGLSLAGPKGSIVLLDDQRVPVPTGSRNGSEPHIWRDSLRIPAAAALALYQSAGVPVVDGKPAAGSAEWSALAGRIIAHAAAFGLTAEYRLPAAPTGGTRSAGKPTDEQRAAALAALEQRRSATA